MINKNSRIVFQRPIKTLCAFLEIGVLLCWLFLACSLWSCLKTGPKNRYSELGFQSHYLSVSKYTTTTTTATTTTATTTTATTTTAAATTTTTATTATTTHDDDDDTTIFALMSPTGLTVR